MKMGLILFMQSIFKCEQFIVTLKMIAHCLDDNGNVNIEFEKE